MQKGEPFQGLKEGKLNENVGEFEELIEIWDRSMVNITERLETRASNEKYVDLLGEGELFERIIMGNEKISWL